jgi:hypothetical protein
MGMKTKIEFAEIKPGDLVEVVNESDGVKTVDTGTAHEHEGDWVSGYGAWYTEEGGVLVIEDNRQDIYRVDVKPIEFKDIKEGDFLTVTTLAGDSTQKITGRAVEFRPAAHMSQWDSWHTEKGALLCHRLSENTVKIEIMENV